jgi:hypothetical protein
MSHVSREQWTIIPIPFSLALNRIATKKFSPCDRVLLIGSMPVPYGYALDSQGC